MNHVWKIGKDFTLDLSLLFGQKTGPRPEDFSAARTPEADKALRQKFASKEIGFYDWPLQADSALIANITKTAKALREEFHRALIFGIGGSHLGPQALIEALRTPEEEDRFPLHWVSNVDGAAIRCAKYFSAKGKTCSVIISKSGGTIETLSAFIHCSHELDPKGYVLITDPKSGELRKLSQKFDWTSFEVPPNVGGRFSVLTPVGLFPCALANLSPAEVIQGALEMREYLESVSADKNPAYALATALHLWDTKYQHKIQYLMPYQSSLQLVAHWFVQLWGESLGKKGIGPTPVAALGTMDQHSLLQLFKEGPRDKVIGFVDAFDPTEKTVIGKPSFELPAYDYVAPHTFEEVSHLASLATQKSLQQSGVPTYRLEMHRLSARSLGAFFFFFETACAFAGELYGINAFDQPGVEEAKKLLRESL